MLTPQDFLVNLASIVNCYLHHQGAAASQEVEDKLYKKDFETPDDDHSNEHQSQVSSGLLSAFLDSFKNPMVGQAPNVTIADFYKMVEAQCHCLKSIINCLNVEGILPHLTRSDF